MCVSYCVSWLIFRQIIVGIDPKSQESEDTSGCGNMCVGVIILCTIIYQLAPYHGAARDEHS
jgi:hypothetical protein